MRCVCNHAGLEVSETLNHGWKHLNRLVSLLYIMNGDPGVLNHVLLRVRGFKLIDLKQSLFNLSKAAASQSSCLETFTWHMTETPCFLY